MWVPVSSCEFNSIEWLWSFIKRRFKLTITQKVRQIKIQDDFIKEVETAAEQVPRRVAIQMLQANKSYILRHLNNHLNPNFQPITF